MSPSEIREKLERLEYRIQGYYQELSQINRNLAADEREIKWCRNQMDKENE